MPVLTVNVLLLFMTVSVLEKFPGYLTAVLLANVTVPDLTSVKLSKIKVTGLSL